LARDERGAVLVEAAFALPMLIVLLLGVVTYGMWFASAHALQEVANEAARSTFGALNASERQSQVDRSIDNSLLNTGLVDAGRVVTTTDLDGTYYTVTVTYDISSDPLFAKSLVPLPGDSIVRSAVVELAGS
jgi:Flp pilus assembly protein TadG